MRYRAEVDGLRALAVLPVILFHAGFAPFAGGFVGVDVFFVISGYLITGLIFQEIRDRRFSIVHFYERRVRRIFPALFLVMAVTVLFAWSVMLPMEFASLGKSVVAVTLFVANVFFWHETGYFAPDAEVLPLLHTWSLAVEEQFYLFFPALLILMRRLPLQRIVVAIGALSILSLLLAERATAAYPAASFFLLPTRAWELGVGALLAIAAGFSPAASRGWREMVAAAGIAAIAWAVFSFDDATHHPGFVTLIPVVGTAAVIYAATPETLTGRLLANRLLVGVGLISYSAYLWHVPVFVFARFYGVQQSVVSGVTLSLLSLVLAYLSWRFVEQPFRRKDVFQRQAIFRMATVACLATIAVGLAGYLSGGFPARVPQLARQIESWVDDRYPETVPYPDLCVPLGGDDSSGFEACPLGREASDVEVEVVVFGDSHARVLAPALNDALGGGGARVTQITTSGCPPALGLYRLDKPEFGCEEFGRRAVDEILERIKPDVVVMLARWTLQLEMDRFDNQEGGHEPGEPAYVVPAGSGAEFLESPDRVAIIGKHYVDTVQKLRLNGIRVVLVYPVPEVGWNVPLESARRVMLGRSNADRLSTSYDVFRTRNAAAHAVLDDVPEGADLMRIWPDRLLCNVWLPGRCVAMRPGMPLYFDDDHLNRTHGAPMLAANIVDGMVHRGWLNGELVSRTP